MEKVTNPQNKMSPAGVSPVVLVVPVPEKNPAKTGRHDLQRIILGLFRKK